MSTEKEIFFHIGLGKTGTTFLQYRAFPLFQNIEYIQRTRFRNAKSIIERSDASKFFLSYECDQQLERVAKDWAATFPDTTPIIVFRRHDAWIASQFRRFVKNCHLNTFDEFFDLKEDKGLFKRKDLEFYPMIEMLERTFSKKVIVLLYEDMRTDPRAFIHNWAIRLGSSVDLDRIDFSKKHSSYSEKQLKGLIASQQSINLKKRVVFKNRTIEFFRKTAVNGTRYLILFISGLLPDSLYNDEPLVEPGDITKVRDEFQTDWERVLARSVS